MSAEEKKTHDRCGNEVFVASGKRLYNRQFANKREKNTVVTDGIRNEFFPLICYALHFLVPSTLRRFFAFYRNMRDTLMEKHREAETKNTDDVSHTSVQSCIVHM